MDNLLRDLPLTLDAEQFATLINRPGARIERIVSNGQATPPGEWLTQPHDEWVLLLHGAAGLLIAGKTETRLVPGDHLLIPMFPTAWPGPISTGRRSGSRSISDQPAKTGF